MTNPAFPTGPPPDATYDYGAIDGILTALYASFTCAPGSPPNMDLYRTLCRPDAGFVRIYPDGPRSMTREQFVEGYLARVRRGEVRTFFEEEIARRTEIYGSIAQVWSIYRKALNTTDPAEFVRGVNGFQLVHDGRRWWIAGAVWQDEVAGQPIPAKVE